MDLSSGTLIGQLTVSLLFLAAIVIVLRAIAQIGSSMVRIADALTRIADRHGAEPSSDRSVPFSEGPSDPHP